LWIIQEVVLAQKTLVVWGNRKLAWGVLMKFLFRVRRNHAGWQQINLDNVRTARGMRKADGSYQLSWEMALRLSQGSKCQEIRDKVYRLLRLVDPALRVQPDYTKEPVQIVSEIIKEQAKAYCYDTNFLPERDLFNIWDHCKDELGLSAEPPPSAIRKWEETIAGPQYYPYGYRPQRDQEELSSPARDGGDSENASEVGAVGGGGLIPMLSPPKHTIGNSMTWRAGFETSLPRLG
jgi:hypothetical protein